jgi:hypothetical protein
MAAATMGFAHNGVADRSLGPTMHSITDDCTCTSPEVGLYAGARRLGLDIRLIDHLSLMIDPVDISLPVFEIRKLPFYYKQWRVARAALALLSGRASAAFN